MFKVNKKDANGVSSISSVSIVNFKNLIGDCLTVLTNTIVIAKYYLEKVTFIKTQGH